MIKQIIQLQKLTETENVKFWLSGGWGMDGLLHYISRRHKDIDLLVNIKDAEVFVDILRNLNYVTRRIFKNSILALGEEFKADIHFFEEYNKECYSLELANENVVIPLPKRGFTDNFNATISSEKVRAVSWEIMYLNKVCYKLIFPNEELRKKDFYDMEIIKQKLTSEELLTINQTYSSLEKGVMNFGN